MAPEVNPQHGLSGPDIVTQMQGMLSRFGGWIGPLRDVIDGQGSAAYGPIEQVTVAEQGEPTDADLRLLELPVPAVQGRLAQPY